MSHADGLLSSQFDTTFAMRFGHRLDCSKLGFRNYFELLKEMSDITMERQPNGEYRLHGRPISRRQMNTEPVYADVEKKVFPRQEESNQAFFEDDSGISTELKRQIQMVLSRKPEGIRAAQFTTEFRMVIGEELSPKELGYLSVIELMSALADIVTIERPTASDWLLFDSRIRRDVDKQDSNPAEIKRPLSQAKKQVLSTAPNIDVIFQETIRQVVEAYPNGVYLDQLREKYKELTDQELCVEEHGFASIGFLIRSLSDVLTMEHTNEGKVVVRAVPSTNPHRHDVLKRRPGEQKVHTPATKLTKICKRGDVLSDIVAPGSVPSDAVGPGNYFVPQAVPANISYLQVLVSNIINPDNFWLQLKGPNTTDALEDLMDEIEETYDNGIDYIMPESLVAVGQVCAAIFPEDGNWHRVTITGIRDLDFVEVFYVDYGSTSCVSKKSLRLLRFRHFKLPSQGINARLANIRPANGKTWTKTSVKHLLSLTADRTVLALVTHISVQDSVMSVCLVDTRGATDIHINDTLVQQGHAYFEKDNYYIDEKVISSTQAQNTNSTTVEQNVDMPVAPEGQQVDENGADGASVKSTRRYVKFVQLTDTHCFHLVRVDDKAYVVGAEISSLLWQRDMLQPMLKQKKKQIPWLVLSEDDSRELFEEFAAFEVPGTMDGKEMKAYIVLYELASVAQILELFAHPSAELKQAVEQQIASFDPEDSYWVTGEIDVEDGSREFDEEEEEEEADSFQMSIANLELASQTLQYKRHRIISAMMAADASFQHVYVEQLNNVEQQLLDIRNRLVTAQKTQGTQNLTKMSAGDRFIQECIGEQYNSYQPEISTQQAAKPVTVAKPLMSMSPLKKTNPVAPMPAVAAPPGGLQRKLIQPLLTDELCEQLKRLGFDPSLLKEGGANTLVGVSNLSVGGANLSGGGANTLMGSADMLSGANLSLASSKLSANAAMGSTDAQISNANMLLGSSNLPVGAGNLPSGLGNSFPNTGLQHNNATSLYGINTIPMAGDSRQMTDKANTFPLGVGGVGGGGGYTPLISGIGDPCISATLSKETAKMGTSETAALPPWQQQLLAQYQQKLSQQQTLSSASTGQPNAQAVTPFAGSQTNFFNPLSSLAFSNSSAYQRPASFAVGQGRGGMPVRLSGVSTLMGHGAAVGQNSLVGQGRGIALPGQRLPGFPNQTFR